MSLAERLPPAGWRTRFAPAPTGLLHLGHLVNALHVWGIARAHGGRVLLRIEDHDRTRCRPEYERALLDDLDWLGLEPDEGRTGEYRARGGLPHDAPHSLRQSDNGARYASALSTLDTRALVYACTCTRREIAQRSPHAPGEEPRYPATCRARGDVAPDVLARRVRLDERVETFDDLRLGVQRQIPARQCGDVLVRDRHGSWTYQFAVTVDDMQQGIDVVIRGEDLLPSTGRQLQLARLLGRHQPPLFYHHVLLRHPDGAKLSKSTHDTSLHERRTAGATAEQLLGEAAFLAGLTPTAGSLSVDAIPDLFA